MRQVVIIIIVYIGNKIDMRAAVNLNSDIENSREPTARFSRSIIYVYVCMHTSAFKINSLRTKPELPFGAYPPPNANGESQSAVKSANASRAGLKRQAADFSLLIVTR
jgi:hypothetical protein